MTDYPALPLPRFFKVRQNLPRDTVEDVAASVRNELRRIGLGGRLKPGGSVAITAGSRGIADIALVLRTVADVVRELAPGAEPLIVPVRVSVPVTDCNPAVTRVTPLVKVCTPASPPRNV